MTVRVLATIVLSTLVSACAIVDGLSGVDDGPFPLAFEIFMENSAEVVSGDFNGDGVADLAVTRPSDSKIIMFMSENRSQLDPSYDGASENSGIAYGDQLWAAKLERETIVEGFIVSNYNGDRNETDCRLFFAPDTAGAVGVGVVPGNIIAIAGDGFSPGSGVVFMTKNPERIVRMIPSTSESATVTTIRELDEDSITGIVGGFFDAGGMDFKDIAYGHAGGFSVVLGELDGFMAPTTITKGPVTDLATIDITGDQVDELALLYPNLSEAWTAEIVEPDGDEVTSITIAGLSQPAKAIHRANIDGSAPDDIVILAEETLAVHAVIGYAGGDFSTYHAVDIGAVPERLIVADFDGDGRDDIAAVSAGRISVYRNNL